ncbi:MAG: transcriptional repressor LexA [Armatimonadetes bacterium]|nr:transcriptional repressor LexA [Armatimonadota bacterium]
MARSTLTERRQAILDYIVRHTREHGYPPTVREIGREVGLSSSSTVHFHLRALEKGGMLERVASLTRAIRHTSPQPRAQPARTIPLVGKVAAGAPILAVENIEDVLPLPETLCPPGEVFALRVQGDSMINAGIMDGDIVIVHQQQTADNGDIVVAILDGEATVKRFFRRGDTIELRPENDQLQPIVSRDASVVGRVCGVLRSYA